MTETWISGLVALIIIASIGWLIESNRRKSKALKNRELNDIQQTNIQITDLNKNMKEFIDFSKKEMEQMRAIMNQNTIVIKMVLLRHNKNHPNDQIHYEDVAV